jgi:hypothetical protein
MDIEDILYNILLHTNFSSTIKLILTCKSNYKFITNDQLWIDKLLIDKLGKTSNLYDYFPDVENKYFISELGANVSRYCGVEDIRLFNKIALFFSVTERNNFKYINIIRRSKSTFYQFVIAIDDWKYGCVRNNRYCLKKTYDGNYYCNKCVSNSDSNDELFLTKHKKLGNIVCIGDDIYRNLEYNYIMACDIHFTDCHPISKMVDGKEIELSEEDREKIKKNFYS